MTAKARQSEQGALKQGGIDLLVMPPKLKGRLPLWRACSVNWLRGLVKPRNPLVHLCAGRDGIVELDQVETLLALLLVDGTDEHATAGDAHHLARRQVGDGE